MIYLTWLWSFQQEITMQVTTAFLWWLHTKKSEGQDKIQHRNTTFQGCSAPDMLMKAWTPENLVAKGFNIM